MIFIYNIYVYRPDTYVYIYIIIYIHMYIYIHRYIYMCECCV